MSAKSIIKLLSSFRLPLSDELRLHEAMAGEFDKAGIGYEREFRLSLNDRVDFMVGPIAIEVKIKGSKRNIFRQVERYALHDSVKELILVTNVAMGFPPALNGKPVYVVNLARAWL